jgi:outer membrane receptor protein involved in Fe transport
VQVGLQALLQGTGLVASINPRGQVAIRAAPSPSETRAAEAPAGKSALPTRALAPDAELPVVEVTGTRIARGGMHTPTPVAALSSEELRTLGPTTLIDALVQLPHFLNNDTPQTQSFGTSAAAGASHLNLRGIGSIRTLTLLDGRRIVPSTRFGTADLALMPKNLLQRVEVVTGGASAAYGSDAVSGVVNLILDSGFRGLRANAQAGGTSRGDNGNQELGVTWGGNVGQASSLLLSAEVFRASGIKGYGSRGWFDGSAAIANPDPEGPAEIIAPDVHGTGYTDGGLITSGPLAGTQFLAGGVPAPFEAGDLRGPTTQSGGSGVDPAEDWVWILPDQQRVSGFARFTSMPRSSVSWFGQMLAGRTRNHFQKDPPSLWGPWEATIYRENAFLPASIGERMDEADITSFRMGRVGTSGDLGRSEATLEGSLAAATTGATWHGQNWSLDGYYQYGRNLTRIRYNEVLRLDRVYRAIDTLLDEETGQPICRSTLSFPDDGCVPLNPFGPGSVSAEARAWITEGHSVITQDVREQTAETTLRGELPFSVAGPLSIATGASWRVESAKNHTRRYPEELEGLQVEPAASQGYQGLPNGYVGNTNIFERTIVLDVKGRYTVWEAFAEALAPLVRDRPFAEHIDLHAAVRHAHYSGSGAIPAWKLGLDWQVVPALRLRATRSRDVRAGSLSERFDFASSGITIVDRIQEGAPVYAVVADREGNPEVEPEKSDTFTAGLVLQPQWARGASLSADYYDIRIRGAIALYGVQNIIDGCADGAQDLCELIARSETGQITRVRNRILNVAQTRARGIDLEFSWRQPVQWFGGGESLALRLFANRALENSVTNAMGTYIDRAGQTGLFGGAPRLQANLSLAYRRGPLQLSLQQRYISSGSYDAEYGPSDINDRHVRSSSYTGARLGWQTPSVKGLHVFLDVQNLFDQDPPIASDWGFGGSMPTNEGLFDVLGRRFTAGLRLEL